MKLIKKQEFWIVFTLACLTILGLFLFWGKQGHIIVDVGREFLISEQVLQGEMLYKDIFNIYGPLAYQINALLLKIFGNNVMTLYIAGMMCGAGIIFSCYSLSRKFFNIPIASGITLFVMSAGIYKAGIFNYVMPYSYAVLYGMLAVTVSLIYLTTYLQDDTQDIRNFYLSLFFGGVAFTLKYDFAPYALIFPYIAFFVKKIQAREIFYSIIFALLAPIISVSYLLVQGLSFSDLIDTLRLLEKIAKAPSLTYFYTQAGVYPTFNNFITTLSQFIQTGLFTIVIYQTIKLIKTTNKLANCTLILILFGLSVLTTVCLSFDEKLTFLPILLILLFLLKIKNIYPNKSEFIFIISSLLISLKTIFYFSHLSYGLFSLPFIFISFVLVLKHFFIQKEKSFNKITCFIFLVLTISTIIINYYASSIPLIKNRIETEKGWVPSVSSQSSTHLLIKKLETIPTDKKIVVLPEGHFINYLSNHKSDPFYNNFIPMYVEAFGEENIINHYSDNPPDYFILNNRNNSEYGSKYICQDYAQNLCGWIFKNYHVVYKIVGEPEYILLRKN